MILALILIISIIIALTQTTEHFVAPSMQEPTDKDVMIKWTDRYIAKNYTKLFHEWLIELEIKKFGKITPDIIPISDQDLESLTPIALGNDKISKIIIDLLQYLNNRIQKEIIVTPTNYYRQGEIIMVKLIKQQFYDITKFYQKDLNENTNNISYLVLKISPTATPASASASTLTSMGIAYLPKIINYPGIDGSKKYGLASAKKNVHIYTEPEDQKMHGTKHASLIKKPIKQFDFHKCFIKPQYTSINNIENDFSTQQSCVINGGIWDSPCKKNIDCPYYKKNTNYPNKYGECNINTGYCMLPEGLTQISFKHSTGKPICYNCKKGSFGNCCKEQKNPDYKFKTDNKQRIKYKELLASKGLNWYKY